MRAFRGPVARKRRVPRASLSSLSARRTASRLLPPPRQPDRRHGRPAAATAQPHRCWPPTNCCLPTPPPCVSSSARDGRCRARVITGRAVWSLAVRVSARRSPSPRSPFSTPPRALAIRITAPPPPSARMSWQAYVDNNLIGTKKVAQGAIHGLDGNRWATSPGFNVRVRPLLPLPALFWLAVHRMSAMCMSAADCASLVSVVDERTGARLPATRMLTHLCPPAAHTRSVSVSLSHNPNRCADAVHATRR
jgi:hypothetical protein